MAVKPFNKLYKKVKIRKYNNLLEALYLSKMLRKLTGILVFPLSVTPDNRIIWKFSLIGLICFMLWYSLYFYATYKAYCEDQTILRSFYNTKVKRYGDDFERISSTVYVVFAMWAIPFSVSSKIHFMGIMVNVDKELENLGEFIDYNQDASSAFCMAFGQVTICLARWFTTWMTLSHLNISLPMERIYQVIYSDAVAGVTTAHFCFFLIVIRGRFKYINKVLEEIKAHKSWDYKVFVRGQMTPNVQKASGLQDRYICEKIKTCAKIYGMLYKVIYATNKMYGTMIWMTTTLCLCYIILYMFYFMEATAAGLFHEVDKYIAFIVFILWQVGYAMGIIFLTVFVCVRAVDEAQNMSFIIHEIINSDFNPSVSAEAMQLSIQYLHQKPIFTASGLYELNYTLIHELSRAVYTYLIILLQFVTDAK